MIAMIPMFTTLLEIEIRITFIERQKSEIQEYFTNYPKFENQFETNERLKGTECRDTISACGDLTGTDDFTYMAAALIEIKPDAKGIDKKKIKEYYESASAGLEGAADSSHTLKVEVFELDNNTGMFTPSICPERTYMFNDTTTVRDFNNCYVVIIYDMGNSAPLDYRTYFA